MKKTVKISGLAFALSVILAIVLAGTALAAGSLGPNPLSGDGNPDGSSLESPNGPCCDCTCDSCELKLWGEQDPFVPGPHGQ